MLLGRQKLFFVVLFDASVYEARMPVLELLYSLQLLTTTMPGDARA